MRETKRVEINHIDGRALYAMFIAGANRIISNHEKLNSINVFPVPDRDTGTNLANTVRTVIDKVNSRGHFNIAIKEISEAILEGARGNSGVIFAQFFYGLFEETRNFKTINLFDFAIALKKNVKNIYNSISEPVEGTMLTLIREWSEFIYLNRLSPKKFRNVFLESVVAARRSLGRTKKEIKKLTKVNVVDAGASGFVMFLEGIRDFLSNFKIRAIFSGISTSRLSGINLTHEESKINFRYCTEAILETGKSEIQKIKKILRSFGDSIVTAGGGGKMRFHIHTDTPAKLFFKLREFGHLTNQKADDMKRQVRFDKIKKGGIALVTDSTCDIPENIIDEFNISVIPLKLIFGKEEFIDGVTIKPKQLYDLMLNSRIHPTTSQPGAEELKNIYVSLLKKYESIISVHVSKKLSGTFAVAEKVAKEVEELSGKKIYVINSKHLSGSLGLLVLRIAQEIKIGTDLMSILRQVENWIESLKIFVNVRTLKYMVRGGRVSPVKGFVASLLNINPIVTINSKTGKSELYGKTFTQSGNMRKVISHIEELLKSKKIRDYIILHAENSSAASWYKDKMKLLTGLDPVGVVNISPVIGANAGPSAVSVAAMFENL